MLCHTVMVTSTNVTYTRNPFQYLQNTTDTTTVQKPFVL